MRKNLKGELCRGRGFHATCYANCNLNPRPPDFLANPLAALMSQALQPG